ncbi:hypothetical protein FB451DRAFT_1365237, partial [Mycena latifolia]
MWGSMPSIAGLPYLLIAIGDCRGCREHLTTVQGCRVLLRSSHIFGIVLLLQHLHSPRRQHTHRNLSQYLLILVTPCPRVSTVASGESTPRISASATGTVITTSSPAVSPGGSSPAHTTTTSSRQRARTAAITGSIVAVCIVVGILLLVLWRLRRIAQLTLPRQFPP